MHYEYKHDSVIIVFQLDYKSIRYYLRVSPQGRLLLIATFNRMRELRIKGLERLLDQDAFWKSLAAVHNPK